MNIVSTAFWRPKAGHAPEEYEDACWPATPYKAQTDVARFAVADGAAEASFSDLWARDLTRAYGKGWFSDGETARSMQRLRRLWQRRIDGKQLAWYAQEKAAMGAFAALVGLTVYDAGATARSGRWQAMAIGDSCLFHVRKGKLLKSFPLVRSEQFNNHPALLSSLPDSRESVPQRPATCSGEWRSGDRFYLLTDALACWLLRRYECGLTGGLSSILNEDEFSHLVCNERQRKDAGGRALLRNDDVTLLRVAVAKGGE
jgi:hypothetical protein